MALQRPAPHSAATGDRPLGVPSAPVSGDTDEPRGPAHGLPEFALGLGLTVRPAVTTGGGVPAPSALPTVSFQPSLDVTQRLGANVLASLTINTDFAETEVDTRRTNLTRFPLFFPEKRTFFLEGDDIFSFGLGLNQDVLPFFSRRIGLVEEEEVPIIAGGKIEWPRQHQLRRPGRRNERQGRGVGRRRARWRSGASSRTSGANRGSVRSPRSAIRWARGSWLAGADFTYATSRFRGDKNFLVGVWGLATGREGWRRCGGARIQGRLPERSVGHQLHLQTHRPRLRSVARIRAAAAVHCSTASVDNRTRCSRARSSSCSTSSSRSLATDLSGRWESYRVFIAPVNWRFRSGDRFEFNANPTGERLVEPFEVSAGVVIHAGSYHWMRYRVEVGTAQKRRLYTGHVVVRRLLRRSLDQIDLDGRLESDAARDGRVHRRAEHRASARRRFHPDARRQSAARQHLARPLDCELRAIRHRSAIRSASNTRLRWTFSPEADLFVVYNHNVGRC